MKSGATLFLGDVIKLGAASSIALQFGKSLVLAAPQTELVVESEGVNLGAGRLQVRANGEDSLGVSGPFFHVNVVASAGAPGSAEIQVGGKHARVSTLSGAANLATDGSVAPYELRAGMMATMDATDADAGAGQAAANSAAGKVSRVLPQVQIDRSATQIIAAVSSPVLWNDDLNSGPSGRAHITLTDGSLLNLGSNSTLRVLQHDAQAQQTSLDLVIGRMRGQVLKLTRPGAKFEIRTPVGTAGLVGTDFSLLVTDDYVELMVFEGIVRFTIFANGQSITVTAGQKLRIPRNGAAVGPLPASPQEMQTAKDLTDIPEKRSPIGAIFAALGHNPPVTVSVSVGAAVLGISLFLNTQEHPSVSPWRPSGQ